MATLLQIDDLTYFARPELSASGMKILCAPGGPAKFRYRETHPRPDTDEFDFGHALHALILGKGAMPVDVGYATFQSNAAKARRDEIRAWGGVPLTSQTYAKAQAMAKAVHDHPLAEQIFGDPDGMAEVAIIGEIDGAPIRCKVDWLMPGTVVDYKTSKAADAPTFSRRAFDYAYDIQAWVYAELAQQALGKSVTFLHLVQDKEAPYLVSPMQMSDEYLAVGEQRARRAIALWKDCISKNYWPGYSDEPVQIDPPAWAYDDEVEIEIDGPDTDD